MITIIEKMQKYLVAKDKVFCEEVLIYCYETNVAYHVAKIVWHFVKDIFYDIINKFKNNPCHKRHI